MAITSLAVLFSLCSLTLIPPPNNALFIHSSLVPRPLPDFISQLRDKIWEWPGDEAMFILHMCMLYSCACYIHVYEKTPPVCTCQTSAGHLTMHCQQTWTCIGHPTFCSPVLCPPSPTRQPPAPSQSFTVTEG